MRTSAFINAIAEEGTKDDALTYLIEYYNKYIDLKLAVDALLADVRLRHPGEELRCPYLIRLSHLVGEDDARNAV